ncbi:hypothetical protein GCM10017566_17430 [Amycolatopsis bartoniae]|uniref:Uncharacterized protein n=1 Tax=Amycolatopsis bartoniae TaxID=941986 RepID=A0A8H9IS04_9PSEU|nr:hypothetical protein GCM10017566_17430 [Amycolatopsis bartoniae]
MRFAHFFLGEPGGRPERCLAERGLLSPTPGWVRCTTGAGACWVDLTVRVHRSEPGPNLAEYEDVVESSYESTDGELSVFTWSRRLVRYLGELPEGPGSYRIRYHLRDCDKAVAGVGLIQLWPAPPAPPAELKISSNTAGFWHPSRSLPC